MTQTPAQTDRQSVLQCARDLATAAQIDTLYRDLFLRRATAKLRSILPESAYRQAGELEPQIAVLLAENRRSVDRQDWVKVKSISEQVAELRRKLQEATGEIDVAKQIYEAPEIAVDPLCVELQPLLKDQMTVSAARQAALEAFGRLVVADPEWADFHRQRRAYFEAIQTVQADEKVPAEKRVSSVAQLRQEAQNAAASGDVTRLASLADEILKAETAGQSSEEGAPRAAVPALMQVPAEIQQPFDGGVVEKAASLGLAHVEVKPESPETATRIADFMRQHQWRAASAAAEIAREGAVRLNELMREIAIPTELSAPASTAILMFAINPFVNSAGIRYQVHFASEYVLVENFPEGGEPPAGDPLAKALELPQRRALARVEIEHALRERGPAILQERLGLEPKDYRLVCVPYDVYLRAGRDLGWGQQPWWTHVDGYQLGRGTKLRALVAGDVRHGGLLDLCAIGADDGRESVMARFAIVRRARMVIGRS